MKEIIYNYSLSSSDINEYRYLSRGIELIKSEYNTMNYYNTFSPITAKKIKYVQYEREKLYLNATSWGNQLEKSFNNIESPIKYTDYNSPIKDITKSNREILCSPISKRPTSSPQYISTMPSFISPSNNINESYDKTNRTEFSSFASINSFTTPVQNKTKRLSPFLKVTDSFLTNGSNVNRVIDMSPLLKTNHDSFLS